MSQWQELVEPIDPQPEPAANTPAPEPVAPAPAPGQPDSAQPVSEQPAWLQHVEPVVDQPPAPITPPAPPKPAPVRESVRGRLARLAKAQQPQPALPAGYEFLPQPGPPGSDAQYEYEAFRASFSGPRQTYGRGAERRRQFKMQTAEDLDLQAPPPEMADTNNAINQLAAKAVQASPILNPQGFRDAPAVTIDWGDVPDPDGPLSPEEDARLTKELTEPQGYVFHPTYDDPFGTLRAPGKDPKPTTPAGVFSDDVAEHLKEIRNDRSVARGIVAKLEEQALRQHGADDAAIARARSEMAAMAGAGSDLPEDPKTFRDRINELYGRRGVDLLPFVGAGAEGARAYQIWRSIVLLSEGRADVEDIDRLLKFDNDLKRGTTMGGDIAAMMVQMVPFMIEFMATSGVYNAGKEVAEFAGRKAGVATFREMVEKLISRKVRHRATRRAALKGVHGTAPTLAKSVAGSAVQAPVAMGPHIVAGVFNRMTPGDGDTLTQDDHGNIKVAFKREGEPFLDALKKEYGSAGIEIISERSGYALGQVFGKVHRALGSEELAESAMKIRMLAYIRNKYKDSTWSQTINRVARRGGWNGYFEELGEEEVGQILRGLSGIEPMHFTTPEELMERMVAFAALPGARTAAAAGQIASQHVEDAKNRLLEQPSPAEPVPYQGDRPNPADAAAQPDELTDQQRPSAEVGGEGEAGVDAQVAQVPVDSPPPDGTLEGQQLPETQELGDEQTQSERLRSTRGVDRAGAHQGTGTQVPEVAAGAVEQADAADQGVAVGTQAGQGGQTPALADLTRSFQEAATDPQARAQAAADYLTKQVESETSEGRAQYRPATGPRAKRVKRVLKPALDALNVASADVVLVDSYFDGQTAEEFNATIPGMYVPGTGVIVLDVNVQGGAANLVREYFGHEWTHRLADREPELFDRLKQALAAHAPNLSAQSGQTYLDSNPRQAAAELVSNERRSPGASMLAEERVTNIVERLIAKAGFWTSLTAENRNLAIRLLDMTRDMINRIVGAFKRRGGDFARARRGMRNVQRVVEKAIKEAQTYDSDAVSTLPGQVAVARNQGRPIDPLARALTRGDAALRGGQVAPAVEDQQTAPATEPDIDVQPAVEPDTREPDERTQTSEAWAQRTKQEIIDFLTARSRTHNVPRWQLVPEARQPQQSLASLTKIDLIDIIDAVPLAEFAEPDRPPSVPRPLSKAAIERRLKDQMPESLRDEFQALVELLPPESDFNSDMVGIHPDDTDGMQQWQINLLSNAVQISEDSDIGPLVGERKKRQMIDQIIGGEQARFEQFVEAVVAGANYYAPQTVLDAFTYQRITQGDRTEQEAIDPRDLTIGTTFEIHGQPARVRLDLDTPVIELSEDIQLVIDQLEHVAVDTGTMQQAEGERVGDLIDAAAEQAQAVESDEFDDFGDVPFARRAVYDVPATQSVHNVSFELIASPSAADIGKTIRNSSYPGTRGLMTLDGDLYIWPATAGYHGVMFEYLEQQGEPVREDNVLALVMTPDAVKVDPLFVSTPELPEGEADLRAILDRNPAIGRFYAGRDVDVNVFDRQPVQTRFARRETRGQEGLFGQGRVDPMSREQGGLFEAAAQTRDALPEPVDLPDNAQQFGVTANDIRIADTYHDGVPSVAFAAGVKQYLAGNAKARQVKGMKRQDWRDIRDGYAAAKAGASAVTRQDRDARSARGTVSDADTETGRLFARRDVEGQRGLFSGEQQRTSQGGLFGQQQPEQTPDTTQEQPEDTTTDVPGGLFATEGRQEPEAQQPTTRQAAEGQITDAGEQLYLNRRNFVAGGIAWRDVKDLNDALKLREVVKSKVWPRPNYEELVENGMPALVAHQVKQVYDAIPTKPRMRRVPTDAELRDYIETVQQIRQSLMEWATDVDALRTTLDQVADLQPQFEDRSDYRAHSQAVSRLGELLNNQALVDAVFPVPEGELPRHRFTGGSEQARENNRRALLLGGKKVVQAMYMGLDAYRKATGAITEGWPAKQEAWQKRYRIVQNKAGTTMLRNRERVTLEQDEYMVVPKRSRGFGTVLADGFTTREAAVEAARELAKPKRQGDTGQGDQPLGLERVQRVGPERRVNGRDVSSQEVLDTFGFRGVNFGNWVTQAERQAHINHAYDALVDLTELLGIPPRAVSLNGLLGLAIGAQGRGGRAAAHFAPGVNEINLTKTSGAGAVAHEWAHGLDHYFAAQAGLERSDGPYLTLHANSSRIGDGIRPEITQVVRDIVEAMRRRALTPEEEQRIDERRVNDATERIEREIKSLRDDLNARAKDDAKEKALADFDAIADKIRDGKPGDEYVQIGRGMFGAVPSEVANLRQAIKDATGRVPRLDDLKSLTHAISALTYSTEKTEHPEQHQPQKVSSNYYTQSRMADRQKGGKPYYATTHEMFARAVHSWAIDRLKDREVRSDYLAEPDPKPAEGLPDTHPRDAERKTINAAIDTLVNTIETRETDQGVALFARRGRFQPNNNYGGHAIEPWPADFPRVTTFGTTYELRGTTPEQGGQSNTYTAAKKGNHRAAARLVEAFVDLDAIDKLGAAYPNAIVVAPHAIEATGMNALPRMYANVIAERTGLDNELDMIQTNVVGHTGASRRTRLWNPPFFAGPVMAGRDYIIVDDVAGSGSTLASLRHYIESHGGRVVAATTLAIAPARRGEPDPSILALQPATAEHLQAKFAAEQVDAIIRHHGIAPSLQHVSEGQAGALLSYPDTDAVRTADAARRQPQDQRVREEAVRPPQEDEDGEVGPRLARRAAADRAAVIDLPDVPAGPIEGGDFQGGRIPDNSPTDFAIGKQAAYAQDFPQGETKNGKRLIHRLRRDGDGKKVGMRSIVKFVADSLAAKLNVGTEQTTARSPERYDRAAHLIRSRTGMSQADLHAAGHALAAILLDQDPATVNALAPRFKQIAILPGSFATITRDSNDQPVTTAEEGVAEWLRRYLWEPATLPNEVTNRVERAIENFDPTLLANLRDAHRAIQAHGARTIEARMRSASSDKPSRDELWSSVRARYEQAWFMFGSANAAVEFGVRRPVYKALREAEAGGHKFARAFEKMIEDTDADAVNLQQMMWTVAMEVRRAIDGPESRKQQRGLRVLQIGESPLSDALDTIEDGVLRNRLIGRLGLGNQAFGGGRHGEYLYLTDYTISDVQKAVNVDPATGEYAPKWDAFETYGHLKTALERWETDEQTYPTRTEGVSAGDLKIEVARLDQENPHFAAEYKRVNAYMDRLLVMGLMSGEFSGEQVLTILDKYEFYWPLHKMTGLRLGDTDTQSSPARPANTDPDSGVRRAFGGDQPFLGVLDAIERRTRDAINAYHTNAVMQAIIKQVGQVTENSQLDLQTRAEVGRIVTQLELDWKLLATLDPDAKRAAIAEYLTQQRAAGAGVPVDQIDDKDRVAPEDVQIVEPGEDIQVWTRARPKAVRVIAPNAGGQRGFYQVENPVLFDLFAKSGQQANATLEWIAEAARAVNQPVRNALTQNFVFAFRAMFRDLPTAVLFGETPERWLGVGYLMMGAWNRISGRHVDAREVGELYSKPVRDNPNMVQRTPSEAPVGALIDNIVATFGRWQRQSAIDHAKYLPGRFMKTVMSPITLFNMISGGQTFSQLMETLPREGQYIALRKRGASQGRARAGAMRVTGNFSARVGSPSARAILKFSLFGNAAQQINYQTWMALTDPDPLRRGRNAAALLVGTMLPATGVGFVNGALLAALSYMMMDDDERNQRAEASDNERLNNFWVPMPGTDIMLRLPIDYGPPGAASEVGMVLTERLLYGNRPDGMTIASNLAKRIMSVPALSSLVTPAAYTLYEVLRDEQGYSTFHERPIVPDQLTRAFPENPELQAYRDTPGWAKRVGERLNISPLKVEYAVGSLFTHQMADLLDVGEAATEGRMSDLFTGAPADIPFVGRLMPWEPKGHSSRSVKELSTRASQWHAAYTKWKALQLEHPDVETRDAKVEAKLRQHEEDMIRLAGDRDRSKQVDRIWREVRKEEVKAEPDQERVDKLERQMTALARRLLHERLPLDDLWPQMARVDVDIKRIEAKRDRGEELSSREKALATGLRKDRRAMQQMREGVVGGTIKPDRARDVVKRLLDRAQRRRDALQPAPASR